MDASKRMQKQKYVYSVLVIYKIIQMIIIIISFVETNSLLCL